MGMLEEVLKLYTCKKDLFQQYEQETKALVSDDPEAVERMEMAVENRQHLIEKIDEIDARLESIRDTSESGHRYYEIGKNRWDYSTLGGQERELFEAGQDIFSALTRIRELETLAAGYMEDIRTFLQDRIKQSNVNVKFSGYLKQMDQGNKGVFYNKTR